jgi:hypothetical protein
MIISSTLRYAMAVYLERHSNIGGNCRHRPTAHICELLGGLAESGSSDANTLNSDPARAACFADLRDHVGRPMQWRERCSSLRRCREGQSKSDSDQPDHFFFSFLNATVG